MNRLELITLAVVATFLGVTTCSPRARAAALIAQQAYVKASNTGANDAFGWSVAISGGTMVVGAHDEASNATGVNGNQNDNSVLRAGGAYIFVRAGRNWSQQAYLKASNTGMYDEFAWSVAMSGDTVVIGAFGEDSSATGVNGNQHDEGINGAGAAYVFVRSGTNWSQQAYLKASNTGRHNWFGYAVAISGDTVVVGALGEGSNATGINGNQNNNTATDAGAVYVFVRSGTSWSQQAYLKASNTGAGDEFGSAVAISGDTLAVGAWAEDSNATGVNGNQNSNSASNSGAAYVFVRNGTNWNQQAYFKASNTRTAAEFAGTVAISGDTLAVGAGAESSSATGVNGDQSDTNAPESGAAYVFVREGTNWSQQAYLKASNAKAGDQFAKVAVSGDIVAVGAVSEPSKATGVNGDQTDHSAPIAGSAYVFVRTGTNWNQQAYLKPSNTRAYDEFSWSLAISGDTVVVGADGEFSNATGVNGDQSNTNAPVSGAAYVFTGLGPPMRTTITVTDTADDGPGTLRAALASAADGDTIDFSFLSTPATIALTSDELSVSNSVTILGPGPNALAVAADRSVFPRIRIFRICSNTVVNLSGLTITNGSARFDNGGGIFNDHATLTVSNCTLSGNYATHFGGGIMNDEGLLRIVNSSVCGNFGGISGGGIFNAHATLIVTNSDVSGNFASSGGGIVNGGGSVRIVNSTVSSNIAESAGGILNSAGNGESAIVEIVNSTVSGNSANRVGGMENWGGSVRIINSTLSGNDFTGIYNYNHGDDIASLTIGNTILNANASGENIFNDSGAVTSLGSNLSSDGAGGVLTNATDQTNTDPKLGPLQDNGGPTFTHAPLPGSPAIDKGTNFSVSTVDQRGFVRTIDNVLTNPSGGDGTDIGAVEIAATPFLCNFGIRANEFGFDVITTSNQIVIVEASTNLANWTPLTTNTLGAGPLYFGDPVPANWPRRFYRAHSP